MKGYTVVDAATVLSTHLTELLKANTAELLSYAEVHKLIKDLPKEQGELVKDIVPPQITVSGIQRVLQLLLNERVSIRDLATILEGIADALSFTRNPIGIAENVRTRLARQICAQHTTPAGYLPLIALTAKWEQNFPSRSSARATTADRSLAMQPSRLSEFITSVRERFEDAAREGRGAGAGHLAPDPAVRARHRRALPRADQRHVAVGNPSPGAAENGRQHLTSRRRLNQRNVNRPWNPEAPSYVGKRSRIGKGSGKRASSNRGVCVGVCLKWL